MSLRMNKDLNEVERKLEQDARLVCRRKNQEEIETGSIMRWKAAQFKAVPFRLRDSSC